LSPLLAPLLLLLLLLLLLIRDPCDGHTAVNDP
jgi:hypothetical protein